MKELIENITEGKEITIRNNKYIVISKTFYTTDINKLKYVKIVLSGHKILVISDTDNYVCIGDVIKDIIPGTYDKDSFIYNNKRYTKATKDYQKVDNIEFGDSTNTEGELWYIDYESEDGENIISLTVDSKADCLLDIISIEDVVI
jgi:hypothetical protein